MDDFFSKQREWEERARAAQAAAAQGYNRLLLVAEGPQSGQAQIVARFVASTYNGSEYPFDLFDLRAVDVPLSDDMLICLDALRWGVADLHTLVPNGNRRIQKMCVNWKLNTTNTGQEQ